MRYLKWVFLFATLLLAFLAVAVFATYKYLGRTPGELMDHAEQRLQGHPKLELIALPVLAYFRETLDAPSEPQRKQQKFNVPPLAPQLGSHSANRYSQDVNQRSTRVLRVSPGSAIPSIRAAAQLAKDGDIVEISAGEYHADVAVWKQKALTIRGVGGRARLYADGVSAEGKAIWVFRNGEFVIENIDFIGTRVADRNGAGIRFVKGRMTVRNCLFYNNETGLLTADNKDAELIIENSEFAYNGSGDGKSHNLYVGNIRLLKVNGSYFHHANIGHLIKSRASENIIEYNRLTDEPGGLSSYELELPNGGYGLIIGNIIQQNRNSENSTIVSYGAEGYKTPSNTLFLINNTIVNEHPLGGAFLRVAQGMTRVISRNNLLVGAGQNHVPGTLDSKNDIFADWDIFEMPQRQNYALNKIGQTLPTINKNISHDTPLPTHEYVHPLSTRLLTSTRLYPGASQPTRSQ